MRIEELNEKPDNVSTPIVVDFIERKFCHVTRIITGDINHVIGSASIIVLEDVS